MNDRNTYNLWHIEKRRFGNVKLFSCGNKIKGMKEVKYAIRKYKKYSPEAKFVIELIEKKGKVGLK